jgi:predicted nucleotidyltransferase
MKYFPTAKLDQAISDRRLKLEQERQKLLAKTLDWLNRFAINYGINKAYIFGSVIRREKFHQASDIDLAVEQINNQDYCTVISLLANYLEREVDIIKLDSCHFADRIREKGIIWTKTP